jgi:hypothetical protein
VKYALVIGLITLLTSCKSGCLVEATLVDGVTSGVKTTLKCQNEAAVKADVQKLVDKLNLCPSKAPPQGVVGLVCSSLASLAVQQLGNKIPASWQCDPSTAETSLSAALSVACNAIPF